MNYHPKLFNGPMVRALLNGTKTKTRRGVTQLAGFGQISEFGPSDKKTHDWQFKNKKGKVHRVCNSDLLDFCHYGIVGDRLWVRETWAYHPDFPESTQRVIFRADQECEHDVERWRPSIFMPRWASRITLEITSVRVEPLKDISEADAIAEGAPWAACGSPQEGSHNAGFAQLWETINGHGSWDANPWVWAIEFKRVKP